MLQYETLDKEEFEVHHFVFTVVAALSYTAKNVEDNRLDIVDHLIKMLKSLCDEFSMFHELSENDQGNYKTFLKILYFDFPISLPLKRLVLVSVCEG